MSRFAFVFVLSGLLCSIAFSQDSERKQQGEKRGEVRSQQKRSTKRSRETPGRARPETRSSDADRRIAFRKRLGELVEKGKLTREEAGQLYLTAFPERSADRTPGRGDRGTQQRYRNGRKVEVKDPAQFKTAGGKQVDKVFDPISLAGGKTQVLIFMDENGVGIRGLFGTAKFLSQIVEKSNKEIQLSAVLLGDDPARLSQFGKRFGGRLSGVQMGASKDGRDGPGALGLNRTISMTVVVARDGKVTHNFVFPQSMLYPDPHVLGAIAGVIGQKRETVAKWLNEPQADAAPTRRGQSPKKRPSRQEIIKRFDKNGDGKLSEEEGRAARKALRRK